MANLHEDLEQYSDELFTKGDVKAGLKIASEAIGLVTVGGVALTALTVWLPGVGITLGSLTMTRILWQLGKSYAELSTEERKQVRAVVRYIKGGFSLDDFADVDIVDKDAA